MFGFSIILTAQICSEWWHLEPQIFENLQQNTVNALNLHRGTWLLLHQRDSRPGSLPLQPYKAWPAAMRRAPGRGQVRRFTMSTSLIRHVPHVGQTIHVDSFKPSALTGKAAAAGGLPGASLAMTRLSITGMKHRLLQPRWNLVVIFFFISGKLYKKWVILKLVLDCSRQYHHNYVLNKDSLQATQ